MKRREYQDKAYDSIVNDLDECASTLLVMATGLGKTIVLSHVAKHFAARGRVLVLAHREELIRQAAEKLGRITNEMPDIEMADEWADKPNLTGHRSHYVVSSIQTQCSGMGGKGRMTRFSPTEFSLVVVDEAHHATAASYRRVLSYYRQNECLRVLGVTATPDRSDEEALGQVFDRVSYVYEINDGIGDGWLVPIVQRTVTVEGLDFSGVRTTAGDLNGADLAMVMEYEANLHGIAHPTFELSAGRRTLLFAASVAHAERLCEILNRHKQDCARFVCGTTDDVTRRRTIRAYRDGGFQFLVNVGVFTEGFDEPGIEFVAVARPTKSRALYTQMVGRGTRPLEGVVEGIDGSLARCAAIAGSRKPTLEVLDFVGNAGRHKLMTCVDILGGKCSEEAIALATEKAREETTPVDVKKLLEKAEAELEQRRVEAEHRRQVDAATRAKLVATAQYSTAIVDAFNVLDIQPARERGWDKGRQPSDKQLEFLRRAGIPNPGELSFSHAHQLIGKVLERMRTKKCSLKQARVLKKHGYDPDASFKEASEIITALAANNWRRPAPQKVGAA